MAILCWQDPLKGKPFRPGKEKGAARRTRLSASSKITDVFPEVAGACVTGPFEIWQGPHAKFQRRRAASAPSPERNTGNPWDVLVNWHKLRNLHLVEQAAP